MQASRSHLFFVTEATSGPPRKKCARIDRVVGIVTMEDLIEELISIEIIDDSDIITDNISKKRVANRGSRRLEFFDMLQRREMMLAEGVSRAESVVGGERPTADEVRALASFLSNNVASFRPPNMSTALLRRLLLRCSISSVSPEEVARGRYVYVRGVPAAFCCLLLHGRLQIRAGNEGFTSEIGPWMPLGMQALTDVKYTPDFTARVDCAARIVIISRKDVQAVLGFVKSTGAAAEPFTAPPCTAAPPSTGPAETRMTRALSAGDLMKVNQPQMSPPSGDVGSLISLSADDEPALPRADALDLPTSARDHEPDLLGLGPE
jgi:hypothetical protein